MFSNQYRKIGIAVIAAFLFFSGTAFPAEPEVPVPAIAGEWWQVAASPDLGAYTSTDQQPVDFGIWQAADGTWQIWSCIRKTLCGGYTRLFYRWEGKNLTDTFWEPKGIVMEADPSLGEEVGGLQAPFVIERSGRYHMFYGDWNRICLAESDDGKTFTRVLNGNGQPDLFAGPYKQTRDPMVLSANGKYYCYYTAHLYDRDVGADFCRTSVDLRNWSEAVQVAAGGAAGWSKYSAECPFVVHNEDAGGYYLFRTQHYGENNQSTVYFSTDPLSFGINDDRSRLGTLPVAAPEIFIHDGQYYIAALMRNLHGIRIARLEWVKN